MTNQCYLLVRLTLVQGEGFIDKHDRDIIPYGIYKPAGIADKAVLLFIEHNVALAFRAGQNFEQFIGDCHGYTFFPECASYVELEHIYAATSTGM
jgi:hypothetical protein